MSDTVTVNYRASFVNGVEFAGSAKQGKPTTTGLLRVIPGWREALQLMKEGARWQLFVPSELAYGEKGARGVGPNSALIFDVELVSVNHAIASNR
jgi:FKBP-type peptidyl-prolyl cis-trans isomerase FklB